MAVSPLALDSWLLDCVVQHVDAHKQYTRSLITSEAIGGSRYLHLIKIVRWVLKINNNMSAIVCDGTHHMFATVPFQPAILDFEQQYQQRITYETVNTHMVVRKACLRFALDEELKVLFKSHSISRLAIVILEITDLDIYLRDKYESNGSDKPFIYEVQTYLSICGPQWNAHKSEDDDIGYDSEKEDLKLMMNS